MKFLTTLLGSAMFAAPAAAQTDYRNLEAGRPSSVEDAYSLERYGFELSAGYRHLGGAGDGRHLLLPELVYGFARGTQASVRLPIAIPSGSGGHRGGLAGLDGSVLVNLSNERVGLPGLAVRIDASVPAGAAGGHGVGVSLAALATRSFGARRIHLNAALALDTPDLSGEAEQVPRWWIGIAGDQTLIRTSMLLIAEGSVSSEQRGQPVTYRIGAGLRRQLAPTLVLDLGLGWEFAQHARGSSILTLGLSHSFGVAFLMPGRHP